VPEAAVVYLRRALVDGMDRTARVSVLSELGRVELVAGDHSSAADHLRKAVDSSSDPVARGKIRSELASAIAAQGDASLSMGMRLQALGELGDGDPETSGRIEVMTSMLAASGYGPAGTDPLARLNAIAAGEGSTARAARLGLARVLALRAERREKVLWHLDRGLEGGTFVLRETADSLFATWAAEAMVLTDELARARAFTREMQSAAAARGWTIGLAQSLIYGAFAAYGSGMLADAEAESQAALDLVQPHDNWWTQGASGRAGLLVELGRTEAAVAVIESVTLQPGIQGGINAAWDLVCRGRVLCAAGRKDEGIAALRECGEIASALGLLNPIALPWRSDLAMNLPAAALEEARSLAAAELEVAQGMDVPRAVGVALRAVAALERDADVVDLLRAAVAQLEASPGILDLARAQLDLGAALRRLGHRVEARDPLLQALEIASRCGAAPLAERAREESLLAGARPRRPRLRGIDALTPAELRVARQAAEGLSNREIAQALFITSKTVADHLGSTYGKLQITSRAELAAALAPDGG
jgi:DNA-binding CsgD family transcriptional regulator